MASGVGDGKGATPETPSYQERCEPQTTAWPANNAPMSTPDTQSLSRGAKKTPPLSCCRDRTPASPGGCRRDPRLRSLSGPGGGEGGLALLLY